MDNKPAISGIAGNKVPRFSFVTIVLNGMPFIEHALKAVYPFAHEIIVVEGAVENCQFAANSDGSSRDGTVDCIRNMPDPSGKIRLLQGKWPEKCEMQNAALAHVTGDYVWLMDSDEIYRSEDLEKIREMIQADPSITQVNFILDNFWRGFDYIFISSEFFKAPHHCRRLFQFKPGARFLTHRPPTMLLPGADRSTEQMKCVGGDITRAMGVIPYHYSYVLESQVKQKIELYNRYGWGAMWGVDMNLWLNEGFLQWTPENRRELEKRYPPWTGDRGSLTVPFTKEHPEVMKDFIAEFRGKAEKRTVFRIPDEDLLMPVIGDPYYLERVLEAWNHIELDAPLRGRQSTIRKHLTKGTSFWNVHVGIAFLASRLKPRRYLEIGVRTGGSFVQALYNAPIEEAVAVDMWAGSYSGLPNTKDYTVSQIDRFQTEVRRIPEIKYIHGNSHVELKKLIEAKCRFDLINVDGDHTEAGAIEDLEDAVRLLNPRGAIVFDDVIHVSFRFLLDVAKQFVERHPEFTLLLNTSQDNGTALFVRCLALEEILAPREAVRKRPKIAGEVKSDHDLTAVGSESEFSRSIGQLFEKIRPQKLIETGTYLGTGTTRTIANALKELGCDGAVFFSIEVNPRHLSQAYANLEADGLMSRVRLCHGLSVPRSILPSIEEIEAATVRNIQSEEIFVDHQEHERAALYYRETCFEGVPDDLLGRCLGEFNCRPDFVILDSGGHLGNVEFNYLIERLQGECHIALDDIYHIKHNRSYLQILNDPRFELVVSSKEKFGFCIAKFSPKVQAEPRVQSVFWVRPDSIGDAVLSLSQLPYIRGKYPDARIVVLCQEHVAELYEASPYVDAIETIRQADALSNKEYQARLVQRVRAVQADVCLNPVYSRDPLSDFLALNSNAPTRVAFEGGVENMMPEVRDHHNRHYTKLIPNRSKWKGELERNRDFLQGIGIEVSELGALIWLNNEDLEFAEDVFRSNQLDPNRTIALFAGAQHDCRHYLGYGEALKEICRERGLVVVGLGAKRDFEINQKNLEATGAPGLNLSGKMTLRQNAAFLKKCRLAVGAETGLAHIACAVEVPNVILLGGGHFGRFMPYSALTSVACLPLECFGCNWQCRFSRPHCVKDLLPGVIEAAVRRTLDSKSQKPRIFVQDDSMLSPGPGTPGLGSFDQLIDSGRVEVLIVNRESGSVCSGNSGIRTRGNEASILELLQTAESLYRSGKTQDAVEHLKQANSNYPGSAQILATLSNVLLQAEDFAGAEPRLKEWLKLQPQDANAWTGLAVAKSRLQDREGCKQALNRVLELEPRNQGALRLLADNLLIEGDYRAAGELYAKMLEATPDDLDLLVRRGVCLFRALEYDAAASFFDRVLKIDPNHGLATENREAVDLARAIRKV
jgi:ADP-heptose:LPS heptosyltransferase/predicted O-methyltransferase YrrM/glycosyltransferase involved in cell wall biosynthesis